MTPIEIIKVKNGYLLRAPVMQGGFLVEADYQVANSFEVLVVLLREHFHPLVGINAQEIKS